MLFGRFGARVRECVESGPRRGARCLCCCSLSRCGAGPWVRDVDGGVGIPGSGLLLFHLDVLAQPGETFEDTCGFCALVLLGSE